MTDKPARHEGPFLVVATREYKEGPWEANWIEPDPDLGSVYEDLEAAEAFAASMAGTFDAVKVIDFPTSEVVSLFRRVGADGVPWGHADQIRGLDAFDQRSHLREPAPGHGTPEPVIGRVDDQDLWAYHVGVHATEHLREVSR